ncbi:MAG: ABC transporter permease, partial [Planctomycetota bacterium]
LIAYFAVLCVALCVAMVLIVVSVMNGFLDKIEQAAKGLFGDIVISSNSRGGIGDYEQFIARLKQEIPDVEAATPFINTYGLVRVPDQDYRKDVQVVGVRLPWAPGGDDDDSPMDYYTDVSTFADGLFVQKDMPHAGFDPPRELLLRRLGQDMDRIRRISADYPDDPTVQSAVQTAAYFHSAARHILTQQEFARREIDRLEALRKEAIASEGTDEEVFRLKSAIVDRLEVITGETHFPDLDVLEREFHGITWQDEGADLTEATDIEKLRNFLTDMIRALRTKLYREAGRRVILGAGIPGLSTRAPGGENIRKIAPGNTIGLSLVPLGRKSVSGASITPVSAWFTVVDDAETDVSTIDQSFVYMPFDTLQELNQMGAERTAAGELIRPKRCSQIFIKLRPGAGQGPDLARVANEVRHLLGKFGLDDRATAETWRQRHAQVIGPIQKQRTLAVTMFGIISLVSVVLIFVIFYMMVVQKTRDIGVIKAIGGSNAGVAGIFLGYGAAIGLIGSILGTVGGYFFVRYINEIQNVIDRWFGWRVWDRDVFLFERIPNEVNPTAAGGILLGAIVAGLLGALIPSIRAARMQPVEALRYE